MTTTAPLAPAPSVAPPSDRGPGIGPEPSARAKQPRSRQWIRSRLIGPPTDPGWGRPALIALLALTAVLYLWGLGASGWANSFYSAAVQAGTKSWKAFFFGSTDAANFITVDKPPAALWVMELSARLFGVNSWSILVPQALEGVATVALLYATVRRWFGVGAGLLAGVVVAVTPVAAVMFRFNNPDALLVLLLTGAAYAMVRALEAGATKWLILASTLVGFGFLTKMLQALVVVPAFALVYLIAAPTTLRRRLWQLLVSGAALAVSSLWWVVAVQLVPAANRPYIGGSQNNSLWNLIFGYNGFGRLTGNEAGSVVGGGAGAGAGAGGSPWGATGVLRLFNADFGGEIAWLLPAALILLVAGLAFTWRARRGDRTRAALMLWGGWLLITAAVFSLGQGIIHPYYAVALAPAVGAIIGIGGATLWARRTGIAARIVLAATLAATAVCSYVLLGRVPSWYPWLRYADLAGGLAIAVLLVLWAPGRSRRGVITLLTALALGLAGPAAYTLATVTTAHAGAIPSAGPAGAAGFGPGGRPGGRGGPGGAGAPGGPGGPGGPPGVRGGTAPTFGAGSLNPGAGATAAGAGGGFAPAGVGGFVPAGAGGGGGAGGGKSGGLLNGSTPTAALTATLEAGSSRYTWVAATVGANQASGYQLATSKPVMAIGGFNGSDPSPTLAQFEQYVAQGKIHYFIAGRGGAAGPNTAGSTSSQISSWVQNNFSSTTVGGTTLYDLTSHI